MDYSTRNPFTSKRLPSIPLLTPVFFSFRPLIHQLFSILPFLPQHISFCSPKVQSSTATNKAFPNENPIVYFRISSLTAAGSPPLIKPPIAICI
ncbi:hypothetical protein HanRHA438_Chr02g0086051 [Helianthus annuus]|uniref:Uncharacterized protein n=1 Tax=Helianthus annuus TaxID=4232 RepID=A0A251VHP4_HELAN|nr:hypothetical protein HanXRQr2_Chr02g0074601 [Helianthus annuus]KAJ0940675.1 hypothetical protein HanRHA438_Chr02g0086051 [Helianthus annuus]